MDLDGTEESRDHQHLHIGIWPNASSRGLAPAGLLDSVRKAEARVMSPRATGLQFLVNNVSSRAAWNMNCLDPSVHWSLVTLPIALSGVGSKIACS